jgi:hypothetical protein
MPLPGNARRNINIEFAGLSILVLNESPNYARVLLPHTQTVAGPQHWPILLVPDRSGVRGAADFAITLPGSPDEYAGWHIRGELTLEGENLPKFEPPAVDELIDLANVAQSKTLAAQPPVAASVKLTAGKLEPRDTKQRYYNFFYYDDKGDRQPVYPAFQKLYDRCVCKLVGVCGSMRFAFTGADGRPQKVILPSDFEGRIVISNLSAASGKQIGHLDAYYECLDAKRRPEMKGAADPNGDVGRDEPDNPDECVTMRFSV